MNTRKIWPTGWRAIVLLLVGSVMGANLIAPAVAHVGSWTHNWTAHIKPRTDARYYTKTATNNRVARGVFDGLSGGFPTIESPAWDTMAIQTPGPGFVQATTAVTVQLTDATGCPCTFRGALYSTEEGAYLVPFYTDVTLSAVGERKVLAMTGGVPTTSGGAKTIEVRMFRLSGSGAATGYGNGSALYVRTNAVVTAILGSQPSGKNATG
jgi:hypothetical protein